MLNVEKMIQEIEAIVAEDFPDEMPGLSILVGKDDQVLYEKGFGLADLELARPCDSQTKYLIASISKQFTCMAIMMLMEEGLLEYDAGVKQYFPDFPDWYEGITIRHLMTHTAGIPDYFTEEFIENYGTDEDQTTSLSQVLEMIKTFDKDFEPGEDFSYSNSAYLMLHHIIESVSGESFESFIQRRMFTPLGMEDSLIPGGKERIAGSAIGYVKTTDDRFERTPYTQTVIGWGDGNIMSTVGDLHKWSLALSSGQLVKPETLTEALTPYVLSNGESTHYGFGHFIFDGRGPLEIWHTGGTEGYRSVLKRFPEEGITLVLLTNVSPASSRSVEEMFERIVSAVMKDDFDPVEELESASRPLKMYECTFHSNRLNGRARVEEPNRLVLETMSDSGTVDQETFVCCGQDAFRSLKSSGVSCQYSFSDHCPSRIVINRMGRLIKFTVGCKEESH